MADDHVNDDSSTETYDIELIVPLATRYASTLRTVAASIGADVGFSIDELEDLRLALSEVVASLVTSDLGPTRLSTRFSFDRGVLSVTMRADDGRPCEFDQLSASIVRAVTDEVSVGDGTVRFEKRPVESFEG